ncbi:hypothetical protein MASR2M29_07830 [Spirochaetota bacterium]
MSKKIRVLVCTGTACFVMGASDILLLEENLPEELKNRVELEGASCLGHCKNSSHGKAPFVMIDDELVSNASVLSVVARIRELADA